MGGLLGLPSVGTVREVEDREGKRNVIHLNRASTNSTGSLGAMWSFSVVPWSQRPHLLSLDVGSLGKAWYSKERSE